MRRRHILKLIGGAVVIPSAGCIDSAPVIDVAVEKAHDATPDHPAEVDVSITNRNDETVTLVGGPILPLSNITSTGQDTATELYLVPQERDWIAPFDASGTVVDTRLVPKAPTDGCWRVPYDEIVTKDVQSIEELSPGEDISRKYALVFADETSCNTSARYVFTETIEVREGSRFTEGVGQEVTVSFTLRIDENMNVSVQDVGLE